MGKKHQILENYFTSPKKAMWKVYEQFIDKEFLNPVGY